MILQSLYEYYQRKSADPDGGIAPPGFEWKEIPFVVVLNERGKFVDLEDTREGAGRKKTGKRFLVPQGAKKSGNIKANLLWGNIGYVFGIDTKGKPERAQKQQEAFIAEIRTKIPNHDSDASVRAVLTFLEAKDYAALSAHPSWNEVVEVNRDIAFRLQDETQLVCQRDAVRSALSEASDSNETGQGFCLVTGERDEIERLHPSIKGVWGAQSSGANIVSFNLGAFKSFGKEQGYNAPVGKRASFSYTTALNLLLGKDSKQRIQVGDASTVFWAERANPMEDLVATLFGESPKDDPDRNTRAVRGLYASPRTGAGQFESDTTRFYVLGLSPNASRISIRFWHVATVGELARNIRWHFDDIEIVHAPHEPEYLSLFRLLVSTATLGKSENIPPNLAGDVMKSVLSGALYPHTLLQGALRRVRAEREVTYPRAALIKACLNRQARMSNPNEEKEVAVSLDEENRNIGYRLGRLFAVLEKTQEEANPGINATIRDRFYGTASSVPTTAFPALLKLKNHHIAKLENRGRAVNLEKTIGQIMEGINDFPPLLSLADQGRFAIGYYHQRQQFFKKSE